MNLDRNWLMTDESTKRLYLVFLICLHVAVCCVSLIYVSQYRANFHIYYDPLHLYDAIAVTAAFAPVAYLFAIAGPSFGYIVGFYFYTMVLGFLWLNCFSDFNYNHQLAGLSAAVSGIAFLVPALFVTSPVQRRYTMPIKTFEQLLTIILVLGAVTLCIGASYNFEVVSLEHMYEFRAELNFPTVLNYAIGIVSNTLLPFAFACFAMRRNYWRAGMALVLLIPLYPITLSKLALFTPAWLLAMAFLVRIFETRTAVVLSLLVPVSIGIILISLFGSAVIAYFGLVNFRMVAIPSVAMEVYNDFFFSHDLTHFCQISVLRHLMACPYQDPIATVMERAYELGSFNASLFATEGIASVGTMLAPFSALVCGLVVAVGNRLSAGLPSGFVLISGAIIPHALLNVPLTTVLVTHGAGLLFLLWYVTPRAFFATIAFPSRRIESVVAHA